LTAPFNALCYGSMLIITAVEAVEFIKKGRFPVFF